METYLNLFEQAIRKQVELVGEKTAFQQAKKAGLGVSPDGHIVSCTGNPQVVLLRLIKYFAAGGNMVALAECTPLINEILKNAFDDSEDDESSQEPAITHDSV